MSDDKATIDRQAAQIAMLSGVLDKVRECTPSGYVFEIVMEALTATQADVSQWEKLKRDAVLEEAAELFDQMNGRELFHNFECAGAIRALKDKL